MIHYVEKWNAGQRVLVVGSGLAVESIVDALRQSGASVLVAVHDGLEQEQVVSALLDRACDELGGELTALVFADKIVASCSASVLTLSQWHELTSINLDARFFCCAEFARRCVAAGLPGSILHLVSKVAEQASLGYSAGASAAGGVLTMSMSLAVEWGRDNIRSNIIATRLADDDIDSDDWALLTLGNLVAYYSSDYASYITGVCHGIDEI